MRVYIAGPYTDPEPIENAHKAIEAGDRVRMAGHTPYIPHLNLFWHLVRPHAPVFWYEYDLDWLEVCDCLIRLPGASKGADIEEARMRELNRPVYTMAEFLAII